MDQVKAALGLGRSRPSTGSGVFSGAHGASAMSATNAGIFAVVQRVVWRVMLADVLPYLLGIPVGEGVNFHQTKFFIPFNFAGAGTGSGLIAADAGDPGPQFAQLATQRFDLPQIAALIRILLPEGWTVKAFLLFRGEKWIDLFNGDAVSLLDTVH